jgi:mono/diheme cytochrome c family protein
MDIRAAAQLILAVPWCRAVVLRCAVAILAGTWNATTAAPSAAEDFSAQRVAEGAAIFARNCSPCHGARMRDPDSAFDLRAFPPGQHDRFVSSVARGRNQMPPWGDLLSPEQIEALWAYVMAGEPK